MERANSHVQLVPSMSNPLQAESVQMYVAVERNTITTNVFRAHLCVVAVQNSSMDDAR